MANWKKLENYERVEGEVVDDPNKEKDNKDSQTQQANEPKKKGFVDTATEFVHGLPTPAKIIAVGATALGTGLAIGKMIFGAKTGDVEIIDMPTIPEIPEMPDIPEVPELVEVDEAAAVAEEALERTERLSDAVNNILTPVMEEAANTET